MLDPAFMDSAVYPVTLDPVIRTRDSAVSVDDTYVNSSYPTANYNANVRLYTSNNSSRRLSFLKFNTLPCLSSNHFITKARMVLCSVARPEQTVAVYAREVREEDYSFSGITYASMPDYDEDLILDYAKVYADNHYTENTNFDITAYVRKWYTGDNRGIALAPTNERCISVPFHSANATVNGKPYIRVEYASLAGLEGYLSYDATSAGKAGTAQVSLANGNLIFLHSDTAMNGARMPVSVAHVYNSCDMEQDLFGCGYGWRTNYHQTLHKEYLDDTEYYVYTDGDGTEHWFKPVNSLARKFKDESGLSMELVPGDPTTIRDKGDSVMSFPQITETVTAANPVSNKVLISSIADAVGNTILIDSTGMRITTLTDGAGRITEFTYSNNHLYQIKAAYHTGSQRITFAYNADCLSQISYEDGNQSHYAYGGNNSPAHLLTEAYGPEGLHAEFKYGNTNNISGLPYEVIEARCWDGSSAVAKHTTYDYGSYLCNVTNEMTGKTLRYHFNDYGNNTSVDDGLGYAVFAEYNQADTEANAPVNHPTSTSRIQRVVNNLLKDGLQCKTTSDWTKEGTGTIEQQYRDGGFGRYQKKFTVSDGNTLCLKQTVSVIPGKTYTLSGYAQSLGAKAWLRIVADGSEFVSQSIQAGGTSAQTELERTQVTFTVPSGCSIITCHMMVRGTDTGTVAWWDSVQLEEGETANHVNLIENSIMDRTAASGLPDCWTPDSNCSSYLSYKQRSAAMPEHLSGNILEIAGRWDRTVRVYQAIHAKGVTGDKLTVGGWCSSYAKETNAAGSVYCRIQVWFCESNASDWNYWHMGGAVDVNYEENAWQFVCGEVKAPIDYNWIRVAVYYNRQMNYADFSNLFLYKESYGTTYKYDANGNLKARTSPAQNTGNSHYDDYNNMEWQRAPGHTEKTEYDWGTDTEVQRRKHLLQSVLTPCGTKTSYTYDAYGNPLSTTVVDNAHPSAPSIRTSVEYNTAGTYVTRQTDARGKQVLTDTDANKGTVTSVTDPNNQTVSYQYDELRRLIQTETELAPGQTVTSSNTYDSVTGLLTQISHNTDTDPAHKVTYTFDHDSLGRQTQVKVGADTVLSTTAYDEQTGLVNSVTYGNGGSVSYAYDDFGRVTGTTFDASENDRLSYGYDAQGSVAYVADHANNATIYTDYDLAGRPCRKTTLANGIHQYTGELTYNDYELPNSFTEYVGPAREKHTTAFTYDAENRPTALNYDGGDAGQTTTTYDSLGRMVNRTV